MPCIYFSFALVTSGAGWFYPSLAEAAELLEQARDILEEVKDEEQEAHDNLPESFQQGERGEEMESYIAAIEEAQDYVDNAYCAMGYRNYDYTTSATETRQ